MKSLVSTPHLKDQSFSTRRDVITKTIFRIMKRFYAGLFKQLHPKMKLKSSSVEKYLEASKQLLSTLSGSITLDEDLCYFITQMVTSKLTTKFQVETKLEGSLKLLDNCLYSYSDKAVRRIFEDSSVRLLFNYFYSHGQEFFTEQKNVQKNYSEYLPAFESLYKGFNRRGGE